MQWVGIAVVRRNLHVTNVSGLTLSLTVKWDHTKVEKKMDMIVEYLKKKTILHFLIWF